MNPTCDRLIRELVQFLAARSDFIPYLYLEAARASSRSDNRSRWRQSAAAGEGRR